MGKEKAPKPKTVKVGVKLAKEGGAFNPAIEEATTTSSSPDPLPSEEEPKGRDFSGDLKEYLEGWENKTTVTWKFNKVLQAWALSNTFDNNKIDAELFKQLCPYLVSVQGGARTRLLEVAGTIGDEDEVKDNGDADADAVSTRKKRAKKIIKLLKSKKS